MMADDHRAMTYSVRGRIAHIARQAATSTTTLQPPRPNCYVGCIFHTLQSVDWQVVGMPPIDFLTIHDSGQYRDRLMMADNRRYTALQPLLSTRQSELHAIRQVEVLMPGCDRSAW